MGALDKHLFEVLTGVWAAVLMAEESPPTTDRTDQAFRRQDGGDPTDSQ